MHRARVLMGLVAFAGSARGQPASPPLVNLLTSAPAVVAVSSTVANAAIVPEHLVDGDLGTAWNSRTGDLKGAWIAARVPDAAHVATIRMTVGFTKVDPKLGDLFTMNPRVRKVRVLRNGVKLVELALDPAQRTLQDIAIDEPGGEYRIEVLEIVPGTNKSWREISVSELEIWGSLPAGVAPKSNTPEVLVGSFDQLVKADCISAMFPGAIGDRLASGERVTKVEVLRLSPDLAVCRVERTARRHEPIEIGPGEIGDMTIADTTIELAPVTSHVAAGDHLEAATDSQMVELVLPPDSQGLGSVPYRSNTVALSLVPVSATETALLAEVTSSFADPGMRSDKTVSTLYRVTPDQLTAILSFESSYERDDDGKVSTTRCRLVTPKLRVACTDDEK